MPAERIQKVLAAAGVASRRGSEALIRAGRVTVDGRPAVIGEQVDPEIVAVAVDGRPIHRRQAMIHLACHKPAGVTSTVRDRHAPTVVRDLVPERLAPAGTRLYPVGRLDRDSEGLLLLTNDGAWAERVLHPRYGVPREYAVGIDGSLSSDQLRRLRSGIDLDEGLATLESLEKLTSIEVRRLLALIAPSATAAPGAASDDGGHPGVSDRAVATWYRVVIRQGWKRQVRRMFGAVGVPVRRLVRTGIGELGLAPLRSGEVRRLSDAEVSGLGGYPPGDG